MADTKSNGSPPDRVIGHPVFNQPEPTADPRTFKIKHASDAAAYAKIDALNREHKLQATPFRPPRGLPEPQLTLQEVLGDPNDRSGTMARIQRNGQIVFHSGGDCGPTTVTKLERDTQVVDKMVSDFDETSEKEIPQFHFLLGDIVYSFGEVRYYYDQFYEPYRDYPAPIMAAAGNHDGMVAPESRAKALDGFIRNFCAEDFVVRPEAGGLSRTAQIQPGVFFTFDAPFVRIVTLYSNVLEDPGVIADGTIGDSQLKYVRAALQRVKAERYNGALLFADHHPPFSGVSNTNKGSGARHGPSADMLAQLDAICKSVGVWPHAFLSGHAHNYQRFTRTLTDSSGTVRDIPYIVCGNIGHNVQTLSKYGATIRAPQRIKSDPNEQVVFDRYDDQNFGYLRVIVSSSQLRIEYHPASDGPSAKTPDDSVTVDLQTHRLTTYDAPDLGQPRQARETAKLAKEHPLRYGRRR